MHIKDLIPWARHGEAARPKPIQPGVTGEHPMAELQRQMNQVFESFWSRMDRPFAAAGWPLGEQAPRSDVVETEEGVEVTIELPGMEMKDVDVSLAGDTLTVKGEKKVERQDEKKGYYVSERSYGSVYPAADGRRHGQGRRLVQERRAEHQDPALGRGQGQGEADRGEGRLTPAA